MFKKSYLHVTSEIAFLKIGLLPSQGKFRIRSEVMAGFKHKGNFEGTLDRNIFNKNGVNKVEVGSYIFYKP